MLVFLGKISTMMHQSERIVGRGETANKMRERPRLNYFVDGQRLCRTTFKFLHAYVLYYNALFLLLRYAIRTTVEHTV